MKYNYSERKYCCEATEDIFKEMKIVISYFEMNKKHYLASRKES